MFILNTKNICVKFTQRRTFFYRNYHYSMCFSASFPLFHMPISTIASAFSYSIVIVIQIPPPVIKSISTGCFWHQTKRFGLTAQECIFLRHHIALRHILVLSRYTQLPTGCLLLLKSVQNHLPVAANSKPCCLSWLYCHPIQYSLPAGGNPTTYKGDESNGKHYQFLHLASV